MKHEENISVSEGLKNKENVALSPKYLLVQLLGNFNQSSTCINVSFVKKIYDYSTSAKQSQFAYFAEIQ